MTSETLRKALDAALVRTPVQSAFRRRAARTLAVLAYHHVLDPRTFRVQIAYLHEHMQPISLDDFIESLHGGALPERAVLVTFDDNHPSILATAAPILREMEVPAVAFVTPGLLDSEQSYWWVEVEALVAGGGRVPGLDFSDGAECVRILKTLSDDERVDAMERLRATSNATPPVASHLASADLAALERNGIAIGNHSWSHRCLPRCDDRRLKEEIVLAHDALTETLGHPPRAFAYPNGDWDPRAERVLASLGYEAAFLFDHRLNRGVPSAPFRTSRLRVDDTTSLDRFRLSLSGFHPALLRMRTALAR